MREANASRSWSLAGRMRLWYGASTLVLAAMLASLGAWFVNASVDREIQSLLREEAEEFQAMFHNTAGGAERVAQICTELEMLHPEVPLAFRLWTPEGELIGEAGRLVELAEVLPSAPFLPPSEWSAGSFHGLLDQRPNGPILAVALDSTVLESLHVIFLRTMALIVLVAVALSLGMGELFSRRVSRWLKRVALQIQHVRSLRQPAPVQVQGAPDEVREVAEALRGMLQELHRAEEDSRLMTAGLAHELGSPIQNLLGETEVLLLSEPDAAETCEVLAHHLEELRELADAVHNLTSLLSAQRPAVAGMDESERFDLDREAPIRLQRETRLAATRGVQLECERYGDLSLQGDKEALMRALRNLVCNAVAWSPQGATVRVVLDGRQADRICWTVDDEGSGIADEIRDQVFEPLFRGPGAEGRRIGYGLGLALVKSAVDAQGGRVRIEAAPGGGARFQVEIGRFPGSAPPR